jgi:hypothetical protein
MANEFSRTPLSRPVAPAKGKPALTPAERKSMKFVDAATPEQSPTRIALPTGAADKPHSPAEAKQLREDICAEYVAKHGTFPELEYIMGEVFKRRGIKLPKKAFK